MRNDPLETRYVNSIFLCDLIVVVVDILYCCKASLSQSFFCKVHLYLYCIHTVLAFSVVRFNTTQFSRSVIPAVTRLWNDLPNHVVESVQLQNLVE